VSGSWQAERGSRRTRRYPREDHRTEVGEDVRVGPMEFQLKQTNSHGTDALPLSGGHGKRIINNRQ